VVNKKSRKHITLRLRLLNDSSDDNIQWATLSIDSQQARPALPVTPPTLIECFHKIHDDHCIVILAHRQEGKLGKFANK